MRTGRWGQKGGGGLGKYEGAEPPGPLFGTMPRAPLIVLWCPEKHLDRPPLSLPQKCVLVTQSTKPRTCGLGIVNRRVCSRLGLGCLGRPQVWSVSGLSRGWRYKGAGVRSLPTRGTCRPLAPSNCSPK